MESDLPKLSILELESLRGELIDQGFDHPSDHLRIYLFFNYFDKVLAANDINIAESFLVEFIEDYIYLIRRYEVWGIEPSFTEKMLQQLKQLGTVSLTGLDKELLASEIDRIEKQHKKLIEVLEGSADHTQISHKAFFPLIDKESPTGFYGIIDSLTVRISKSVDSDKFIVVPSEKEIEKRISDQCKNSWLVALNILNKYVRKPFRHHEVIISFDKKVGIYEGYSLGIALTLSFIEELLKFYNPQYIIKIREKSAFTGGLSEEGYVLDTGEDIIKQKVAAAFYSDINSFVFPKLEETYAYFALTQLKKIYPQRTLKLIPIEDINDVLNRRDLVEIKKINPVIRTGRFIKRNWISVAATIILAILFAYLFAVDWDDNPASLLADGSKLYIKNKNGNVLWSVEYYISPGILNMQSYQKQSFMIIDIDDDNNNEVIIVDRTNTVLICYSYQNQILWKYRFTDVVNSIRENLNAEYGINIIDTLTFEGEKNLFLFSSNKPSFSSAIFRLSAKTGKRLKGTFWASGHIMECILKDVDDDGKMDIVGVGYDNGYKDLVFFAKAIDTLNSVRPTVTDYQISDYAPANMKVYIRFPKNDYDIYNELYTPGYNIGSFLEQRELKKYVFSSSFKSGGLEAAVGYEIDYNFKDVDIVIDSDFGIARDSLVVRGSLYLPFTDTEEYKNIIKSNILYYKNGEWVRREEMN